MTNRTKPATSILVDSDGRAKTYVVVDDAAQRIVAATSYFDRDLSRMKAAGVNLTIHNLTHPKCPDWLRAAIKADPAYCAAKAAEYDRRADALRQRADALLDEAAAAQATANIWAGR